MVQSKMGLVKHSRRPIDGGSIRKVVRSIVESRLEHKRITSAGALADVSASGVVNTISMNVAQGDDINSRSGDIIRPRNLRVKVEFVNSSSSYGSFLGRVIVFQDKLCAGSTPAVTDVLDTANPLSGWNLVNKQANRFKILLDRSSTVVGQTNKALVVYSVDIPLKGSIHYLGTTAASTSQGRNNIFALFISSGASVGAWRYAWSYDLTYTDA